MSFSTNAVCAAATVVVTFLAWKTGVVKGQEALLAVALLTFAASSIVSSLIGSEHERKSFKTTYQKLDRANPETARRPRPKTLIALSAVGLVGSVLLGMPVLPWVFAVGLLVFALHYFMIK